MTEESTTELFGEPSTTSSKTNEELKEIVEEKIEEKSNEKEEIQQDIKKTKQKAEFVYYSSIILIIFVTISLVLGIIALVYAGQEQNFTTGINTGTESITGGTITGTSISSSGDINTGQNIIAQNIVSETLVTTSSLVATSKVQTNDLVVTGTVSLPPQPLATIGGQGNGSITESFQPTSSTTDLTKDITIWPLISDGPFLCDGTTITLPSAGVYMIRGSLSCYINNTATNPLVINWNVYILESGQSTPKYYIASLFSPSIDASTSQGGQVYYNIPFSCQISIQNSAAMKIQGYMYGGTATCRLIGNTPTTVLFIDKQN